MKDLTYYDRIGWFRTSQNVIGYNVFEATDAEKKEFGCTHRVTSFRRADNDPLQWTSLVKIENGWVKFLDNNAYTFEGEIKYERGLKVVDYMEEKVKSVVSPHGEGFSEEQNNDGETFEG